MFFDTLLLYANNDLTRNGYIAAAERAGLTVNLLSSNPVSLCDAYNKNTVIRAPGGLVASAQKLGAKILLAGPTTDWFINLPTEVTGRVWCRVTSAEAALLIDKQPSFVKLADAKHHLFPAKFYKDKHKFYEDISKANFSSKVQFLSTSTWFDIASEYRVFTLEREVLTVSPYLIENEPWTSLLYTHRASFHKEVGEFATELLNALPGKDIPPGAVLDIARLVDGRFVLLEANQCWGAGLYGCDPYAAFKAVFAANEYGTKNPNGPWIWKSDPEL